MKNMTSEIHYRHSEKLIWTKDEYESQARRITTGRVLSSNVNQSSSTNKNTIKEMPKTTDILRGANRYGVLEDSVAITTNFHCVWARKKHTYVCTRGTF